MLHNYSDLSSSRIPLLMPHESAALVGGLRQAIDDMLVRMAMDPSLLMQPPPHDEAIIQTVNTLVSSKPTPPSLPTLPPGGYVQVHTFWH